MAYTLDFSTSNIGGMCNDIQFTAITSNVTNLSWTFGDGGSAGNVPTPTHTYAAAGYYQVTICGQVPSTTGGFCPICTTKAIAIPIAANFRWVAHCDSVTYTDISTYLPSTTITSWNWSFPGGVPSSATGQIPPKIYYASSGIHPVTLVISNGTCNSTITQNVNVAPPPSAAFILPSSACVGQDIPMSAGPAFTWLWNFGDAATSAIQNTSHAWSTPGTYIVKLTVTDSTGCIGMVTHSITINPANVSCSITPANPAPVCAPGAVTLTASTGTGYQWYLNGNMIPTATLITYSATVTGTYTVVVFDLNGCPCTSQPVNVIVNPLPPAIIIPTGSAHICGSGTITLSAPPGYTYLWSNTQTSQSISLNLNIPGTYVYTVTVTDGNTPPCSNTSAPFTVIVYPTPAPPTITPSGLTALCKGGSVTLTSSSAVNNMWNTGATTQSITVSLAGVYTVTVTDPNGCIGSASITVTHNDPDFSLYPIGCNTLCDTVKIPGPIGPYIGYYTYQWLFNGVPIPPANGINDTLTPVGSGLYSLILTGPGPSFCRDTSNTYSLSLKNCDSVHCHGSICGLKWNDLNGNHKLNYGAEHGIPHWRICLVKCNIDGYPTKDTIACTYTDSSGHYCFTNLCAGEYCVVEEHRPGWVQTWPISPRTYHVVVTDSGTVSGVDFGNHFNWIHIYPTPDTIGVIDSPIFTAGTQLPDPTPWPVVISYAADATTPFVRVFEGIVTGNISPIQTCKPGIYSIKRKHVSDYNFDRIYVNDTLRSVNGDSVVVTLPDSINGITIIMLNTFEPDTSLKFRTFTAGQLAAADQVKPVKRPKPGKPIPMPNTANVIDEIMKQGGLLIAGRQNQFGINHKLKGYLYPTNQGDVFKTFNTKSVLHTGSPHGFDFDASGGLILKRQKSMPAVKHNNRFLADLLALKINIAASERGKTPIGLGDLVYLPPPGSSPWFVEGPECTVSMIADIADSVFTNWEGLPYQQYQDLDAVISAINSAFAGTLPLGAHDTLKWVNGGKLILTGAVALKDVPYLIQVSGIAPRIVHPPVIEPDVPNEFSLGQNYPNPFNPTTRIQFTLPVQAFVTLKVYNVLGQEVASLLNHDFVEDGTQEVEFDAGRLPSGVYFYHMVAESQGNDEEGSTGKTFMSVRKMLLIK
jgi:PKD repeat protein